MTPTKKSTNKRRVTSSARIKKIKSVKAKSTVFLQCATRIKTAPTRAQFVKWIQAALKQEAVTGDITIRLVDETESAYLNENYRYKTGPTNVLAFPYCDDPLMLLKKNYLGDIAICAPLVQKEARVQRKAVIAHWAHLTIHATLHLLGYDHIKQVDARKMERVEIELLDALGFDNPY